ncbi:MAG: GTP cyclohydrolase II [SAR86 cluster bacterium]|nr:GTP cyclohydrolase II [SAR86 cluster bacterium]
MKVNKVAQAKLPTEWAEFTLHAFVEEESKEEHLAICLGNLNDDKKCLLRIHSQCLTGDALFSLRCDCGDQLKSSLKKIVDMGKGLVIYMAQEGRGIGLANKIKAYQLQDEGLNTIEANVELGFAADERDYSVCAEILKSLDITKVDLMTNNPDKINGLASNGIEVEQRISAYSEPTVHNKDYLKDKKDKMGHLGSKED